MRWATSITDKCAEFLRFLLRATFMSVGFMAAAFCVWFTARFLWRLHEYLERVWFSGKW
jgi:hypothetical protein